VLGVLALTNLFNYAARNSLFTTYDDLRARLGLTEDQLGLLTTVFMLAHALATLPLGMAGDRFDRRRVISFGVLLASLAGMAGAASGGFAGLAASRALVGLGTAAIVPLANSVLGQIFDGPVKASRIAIFNLGLFIGGAVGFKLGQALGFPNVVLAIGAPGAVLSIIITFLPVPRHPAPPTDVIPWWRWVIRFVRDFGGEARRLLSIRTLRWLIGSTTAMAFASGGYLAWFFEYLKHDKGIPEGRANTLLIASLVGGLGGILTGGRFADFMRRGRTTGRLWTIVIGMSATVPGAVLCIELPEGLGLTLASIGTFFFISWYHAPMAATVDDLAPPAQTAAAQALVIFTMHTFGTAPASWLTGLLARHSGLYTAMWLPTGMIVVAALCMMMATTSYAADAARARGTGSAGARAL
jgi:predicted MFS family arabinose efflux permease